MDSAGDPVGVEGPSPIRGPKGKKPPPVLV